MYLVCWYSLGNKRKPPLHIAAERISSLEADKAAALGQLVLVAVGLKVGYAEGLVQEVQDFIRIFS
jgi:hypothetical protein